MIPVERANPHVNKENEENQDEKPYRLFEEPRPGKHVHIYLSDGIGEAKDYIDLIQRIKTACPDDIIYIYLNTPGGYMDAGMQIILAMRLSKARLITVLEGKVCSLGALIFLSADEFVVHENTVLMIHNHSGGQWGKGHEYLAQADATSTWFEGLAKKVYKNFLTDKEIKEMLDGKDFWFQAEDVVKRLEKMEAASKKETKPAPRTPRKKSTSND